MLDDEAVLFASEAFYRAFNARDIDAFEEMWAADDAVACIHASGELLVGRAEVMDKWRRIFASRYSPIVEFHEPRAFICGDVAFVISYEVSGGRSLVGTNVFRRVRRRWRMVHHQSGRVAATVPFADAPQQPPAN
jgi:ketosteroid isomerase-like protein